MKTIRDLGSEQQSGSFRDVAGRYSVNTLRQLIDSDSSSTAFSYQEYKFERTDSAITILNKAGEKTEFKLDDTPLTPEQRKAVLDKVWEEIKKFVKDNWEHIKDGKMKAVDIGGALFASVAGAIFAIFLPFGKGPLADILLAPFVGIAANRGRYFGAAVDELVAILKDESDLTKRDVIGVLGTTAFAVSFVAAPVIALIPLGGTTAWELTVSVGKWVGGAVEDALDEIKKVPVVGPVVEVAEDVVEGIVKFLDGIF